MSPLVSTPLGPSKCIFRNASRCTAHGELIQDCKVLAQAHRLPRHRTRQAQPAPQHRLQVEQVDVPAPAHEVFASPQHVHPLQHIQHGLIQGIGDIWTPSWTVSVAILMQALIIHLQEEQAQAMEKPEQAEKEPEQAEKEPEQVKEEPVQGPAPRMSGAERLLKLYGWEEIGDHPMTLSGPEHPFTIPGGAVWPPSDLMLLHEPTVTGIIEMDMARLADGKPGSYPLELLSWSYDEYKRDCHVEDLPRGRLSGSEANLHLQHLGYTRYPEVLSVWCSTENGRVYELRRPHPGVTLRELSDLLLVLHTNPATGCLDEGAHDIVREVTFVLLKAVKELHALGWVHCDLEPAAVHVWLDCETQIRVGLLRPGMMAKVQEGFSPAVPAGPQRLPSHAHMVFMSPEWLKSCVEPNQLVHAKGCDIFSAASIALYALQGYLPWVDAVAREIQPDVYKQRAECLVDPVEVYQDCCLARRGIARGVNSLEIHRSHGAVSFLDRIDVMQALCNHMKGWRVLSLWAKIGQVWPGATTFFTYTLSSAPTPDQRSTAEEALQLSWFRGLEASWTPYARAPFSVSEPEAAQCPAAAVLRGGAWDDYLPKPVQQFVQQWLAEPASGDLAAAVIQPSVPTTGQREAAADELLAQQCVLVRAAAAVHRILGRSFRCQPQDRCWLPHGRRCQPQDQRSLPHGHRRPPQDRRSLPHGQRWMPRDERPLPHGRRWPPQGHRWRPHGRPGCQGSQ